MNKSIALSLQCLKKTEESESTITTSKYSDLISTVYTDILSILLGFFYPSNIINDLFQVFDKLCKNVSFSGH